MNKVRIRMLHKVSHSVGAWMTARPMILALLSGITLFVLAGFAGGADDDHQNETDRAASKAAIERFWSVYHGNEYSAIPQVQAQLQSALHRDRIANWSAIA